MKLDITTGKTIIDFKENKIDLATHIVKIENDCLIAYEKTGRRINKLHAIKFLSSPLLRCRRGFTLRRLGNCFCHGKTSRHKIKEPYFAPWWAIQGSLTSCTIIAIPHYLKIINHFGCQNVDIMIMFWYNNNSS